MKRFRGFIAWIADWRTGATFAATLLVVLLGVVVIDGRQARDHALQGVAAQANQARSSQEAATRRIDQLTGEIQNLRGELDAVLSATSDEQRQKAVADAEQRRTSPTTTTTTPAPANPPASAVQAPAAAPQPTTTTTTAPPPPTTTPPTTAQPCTTIPVLGTCLQTKASSGAGRTLSSTAYCETGRMASGRPTYAGAVAGNQWPLGTVLEVSDSPWGPGRFTVEDRIGWGSDLDFAIPGDCAGANQWGRRPVTVEVS